MNIISTFNDKRFTLNGIQYFKNYISVVRGNKIEIFNCYERKDVLVELTHYNQFSIDGIIYTSAALLQEALLPIIYSRINMGDGSTFAQNNIGKSINLGIYFGDSSVTAIVAKMNNRTTVISAIDTPVVLSLNSVFSSVELGQFSFSNKKYLYLFRPGAGTYGIGGTTVTTTMITQLATLNLTPDDVQNDPGAIIYNIDPVTNGDYLLKANSSLWDFSDSGHINEDDSIKTYYFSYSVDNVLYFAQFKGTPGVYGLNNTPFEEEDFVATTNSNITPTPTFEQILAQGGNKNISQLTNNGDGVSPYTTVAKLNGLTITVNQAAAEMYLKNSEGTTLATVNLAFLNNEGTTFFYNQTTQKLELKNDAGTILSEVSVSAFVSNLMQTVDFNGANSSILEFKDAAGNVVDSATFTINNISGLQAVLNAKANLNGGNSFNGSQSINGGIGFMGDWAIKFNEIFALQYNSTFGGLNLFKSGETDGVLFAKNNLNVGIGTTNPQTKFDVNGIGRFKRTSVNGGGLATASIVATDAKTINDGVLQAFQAHNSANSEVTYSSISTNIDSSIAGSHSGSLEFRTTDTGNATLALKLSKEGNVGIGTSSPQAKLDINGAIRVIPSAGIEFGGSVGNGHPFIGGAKNDGLYFFTNTANTSTERMRLLPNGNVGVGLNNPVAKLDVNGSGKFSGEVTVADGTALGSAVNKSQLDLKANLDGTLNVKNALPGSIDLNNYKETGIYTQNSDVGAFSGINYPLGLAGKLEVVRNYIDNTMLYQTYHTYGNTIYHRAYYNGVWSSWKELTNNNDVLHKTGNETKNGTLTLADGVNIANGMNITWGGTYLDGNPTIVGDANGIGIYPAGSADAIYIERLGNVGIGTSSPQTKLDVRGAGKFTGQVTIAPATIPENAIQLSQVTSTITTLSNSVASNYIPKTGAVTKEGTMTFTSAPIVPNGTLNNHTVNLGQLGIQSGDAHEKGYLKSATFIGNVSDNYQDNDLINSKIKYIIYFRNSGGVNYSATFVDLQNYSFNSVTGTIGFIMSAPSYIVVNYVK